MAHLHASAPSPAHSPLPHPDSLAGYLGCDRAHLYEQGVNDFFEALHVLCSNPNSVIELQHAIKKGMRGVTALKRLTTLERVMEGSHLARGGVAAAQSPQKLDETPALQATVLTKKRRQRRYFSPSYKLQVAQLIRQENRSVNEVSQELNLAKSILYRWLLEFDVRQALATDGPSSPAAPMLSDTGQRIRQLEERLQQLQADNDLLKKASALFAREISVQGQ
ncbi:MAG: transposase [Giesbergeria sp.]|uniref:transposase n=1 Tax=Giesbergeria sp. TaxID=2818473 RepID=UPI002608F63B|nr:transposase [Giesbergeria sp.]MDD2610189.1 transposase [Giesbergeria sp.]